MNKFAEVLFGKIANIYDTTRTLAEFKKLFVPATLIIDVSKVKDVNVGYRVNFTSEIDFEIIPPKKIIPATLEEAKIAKIAELKSERDNREVQIIHYKDKDFDYDDKARERMRIAKEALEDNSIPNQTWTCADNSTIELTVEDFKAINTLAAQRSGHLHEQYNKLKIHVDGLQDIDEVNKVTFDIEL